MLFGMQCCCDKATGRMNGTRLSSGTLRSCDFIVPITLRVISIAQLKNFGF